MPTICLENGPLRCELRPDLGGCVAGLWWNGEPVLRSTPGADLTAARQSASYPLVPFSNRIAQARLVWDGTGHPLVRDDLAQPHAIHGLGWMRPWEVLEQDTHSLLISHEHRAESQWPFAYDASQTFRLLPNALEMTMGITNQSQQAAPVGLGWHPYFVKRQDAHIEFEASGRWEMGNDKLPTERLAHAGLRTHCTDLDVDHCFDGWTGSARLRDARFDIRLESSLRFLVVFTHPSRDNVAVEPVSHVNNALHLQAQGIDPGSLGVRVLAPGESFSAHMRIDIQAIG